MRARSRDESPTVLVLVRDESETGRGYTARVLSLPSVEISAPTESEAVAGAQAAIADVLRGGRIVEVDVETEHPLAALAGLYQGDEQFEEVLEEIRAYREEISAEELAGWEADASASNPGDLP